MLSGYDNRVNTLDVAVRIVFYRNLRLSVGAEIGQRFVLAHLCQLTAKLVR